MLSVPPTLSVMEETGMVQVCVTLTGQLEREVLVNVTTTDGTAMGKSSPLDPQYYCSSTFSPYLFVSSRQ